MIKRLVIDAARGLAETQIGSRLLEAIDLRSDNRLKERGALAFAFEFAQINGVRGDYLEFGLWRGKTFLYARELKLRYRLPEMKLWGFDSFQGLPTLDDHSDSPWAAGEFACSEGEFRQILRKRGVSDHEFELVPGYYERSLDADCHKKLEGRSAAIVYVDCDLYTSTIQVLNFVRRYLVNGTIVCFDDFFAYKGNPQQGEQKALSEFIAGNPEFNFIPWFAYSPIGQAFIVRVASKGE